MAFGPDNSRARLACLICRRATADGAAFVLVNKGLPSQEVDVKRLREFDWESSLYGTLGIASLEIALDQETA